MKVGVNLINFGPGANPESFARWARLAESLGYHFLMISDHVAVTADVGKPYPAPFHDPLTTLGWLIGIVPRLKLGTTVAILPYRHPLLTASMIANLDRLSGGRMIFGVGVGWARLEFEALGIPFRERGALADDYLAALHCLWKEEVASYSGRYVSFREVQAALRPAQTPHPPIWVGGSSEAAMRRAVRFGDGWHPLRIRIDWLEQTGLPQLKRIADQLEKPVPAFCPRIKLRLTREPAGEERLAGEGSLDQIRGDLEALQSLGARWVLLDTYTDEPEATRNHGPYWHQLARLADEVLDLDRECLR